MIAITGCKEKDFNDDLQTLNPEPDKAISIRIHELAQEIRIIELDIPDGIFLGNTESIRVAGDYFILHDGLYSHSITVFDQTGKFVSQLSSIGRGPGEYLGSHAYAVIENNSIIIVNDRGSKFLLYSFPKFEFITSFEETRYFMSMESLDEPFVLTISDSRHNNDEYTGAELFNVDQKTFQRLELPAKPAIIDLSYQNTLTRHSEGVYYSSPGFLTSVFDIGSDTVKKIVRIDFGKFNMPDEVWEWNSPERFETVFFENPKATWVQLFNKTSDYYSFFFLFSPEQQRFFSICNIETSDCIVYNEIALFDSFSVLPAPIGLFDEYYITYLEPWQIKELVPEKYETENVWENQLINARDMEKNILVLFTPIFPNDYYSK